MTQHHPFPPPQRGAPPDDLSFDDVVQSRPRKGRASPARAARHIVDRGSGSALLVVDQPIERRPWIEGVAVLAGLLIAIALVAVVKTAGPDGPSFVPAETPAVALDPGQAGVAAGPQRGRIGTPIRDGDVEFTVQGTRDAGATDGGQVLLVAFLVRNAGSSTVLLPEDGGTLTDDVGRTYQPEPTGERAGSLEPGRSRQQILTFALGDRATPASIQLNSGSGSGGVVVDLQ